MYKQPHDGDSSVEIDRRVYWNEKNVHFDFRQIIDDTVLKWNEWVPTEYRSRAILVKRDTPNNPFLLSVPFIGEKKSANREHTVVVEPSGETVRWRRFRLFSVQWRHDAVQEAQHLLQEQMGEGVFAAVLRASILLCSVYLDFNLPISLWIVVVIGVGVFRSVFRVALETY